MKTFERESKRELDALDKQLGKAEASVAKMEAAFAKCEDNEKAMHKLIKQEKETYEQRVEIMKAQQELVEKDVDKTAAELKRLQKAFKDGEVLFAKRTLSHFQEMNQLTSNYDSSIWKRRRRCSTSSRMTSTLRRRSSPTSSLPSSNVNGTHHLDSFLVCACLIWMLLFVLNLKIFAFIRF